MRDREVGGTLVLLLIAVLLACALVGGPSGCGRPQPRHHYIDQP